MENKLKTLVSPEKLVKKMFSKSFSPLNQNLSQKYIHQNWENPTRFNKKGNQ